MKKYDLIRNSCIISVLSLTLIFTMTRKDNYVDIGDNLYECEFALCDDEIKLIRPIGNKNYYDIIEKNFFPVDSKEVIYKAPLVDFLTNKQIEDVLSYKIKLEEIEQIYDYVCETYSEEWLNGNKNNEFYNIKQNVKTLKR